MGEITITFWGICTIIREEIESVWVPKRIVLVDASDEQTIAGNPHLANHGIVPHMAKLRIPTDAISALGPMPITSIPLHTGISLRLAHVRLAIPNAIETPLVDQANCLPHIGPIEAVGSPLGVTLMGGPAIATIYELNSGTLAGFRKAEHGAGISVLTVQTNGDPVLTLTEFQTTQLTKFTLYSGAHVLVTNLPDMPGEDDHDEDFRLHYLTASVFPPVIGIPAEVDCPLDPNADDGGLGLYVGPGCSNSNYP